MVVAPAGFGQLGGQLLIGNFGDGKINAFDPVSGALLGSLADTNGAPISIEGLWAVKFGNGGKGGNPQGNKPSGSGAQNTTTRKVSFYIDYNEEPAPGETLTLRDARGGALAEIANDTARSQHPRPLGQLGNDLPRVTIALEDHRFDAHGGVDWRAVAGAAWRNLRNLRAVSGASTITQQLVKDALGRPPRTVANKFREAAIAWKLERRWSKAQTLERYLNTVYFGNGAYGVQTAAETYFGKNVGDLDWAQAALLAALIRDPRDYDPFVNPALAIERRHIALEVHDGPPERWGVGKVARWGSRVAFTEGVLYDPEGRVLAKATGTAIPTPFQSYKT
jgi:hypothetical protein